MKPLLLIFIIAIVFSKNAISQAHSSAAEQTTYYEYDDLGNTTSLTNDAGSVVEKYKYDVFGKPAITDANNNTLAASAFGNRYMFTGREFMEQLNMYDYRNRIYSPQEGRFIQIDPIRFKAGDINIYRYVFNDPINWSDPFGYYGKSKIPKEYPPLPPEYDQMDENERRDYLKELQEKAKKQGEDNPPPPKRWWLCEK